MGVGLRPRAGAPGHGALRYPGHPPVLVRGRAFPLAVQGRRPHHAVPAVLQVPTLQQGHGVLASDAFTENNLCEVVRGVAGDLCEDVKLIDEFTNPKLGRTSHCYRVVYRSMDRSLTNEEIDALQERVREEIVVQLGVELR